MLANIISIGKAKMISEISVHRELGGMSESFENIASINGLPKIQAMFPYLFTACSACSDIMSKELKFKQLPVYTKIFVVGAVFFIVISKRRIGLFVGVFKRLKKILNVA